mmetsp:Transcript_6328/g.13494  ORF Transcript_6328/g.13494 Transcript_6328/m.13494 type:complete len:234 (+) Transcript_6328:3587-4288(+)
MQRPLELLAIHSNHAVIAAASWRALSLVRQWRRQCLRGVEINKLLNWTKLARNRLEHLLRNNAAERRCHRPRCARARARKHFNHFFIRLTRAYSSHLLLHKLHQLRRMRRAARRRQRAAMHSAELIQHTERCVQRGRAIKLAKVRDQKIRLRQRRFERLELQRDGHFDLRCVSAAFVVTERLDFLARTVLIKAECVRAGRANPARLTVIDSRHSAHFRKRHVVIRLEIMAMLF